jgi:hypothetical protein
MMERVSWFGGEAADPFKLFVGSCETLDNLRDKVPELRASIHANDEAFKCTVFACLRNLGPGFGKKAL